MRPVRLLKRVATGLLILLAIAILAGSIYEQVSRRRAAQEFPPPGKLIDIGGRRIHLDCRGGGSPVVVLESGADTPGSTLWAPEQDPVAKFTRVCSYDRAGLMWSDPAKGPRDGITRRSRGLTSWWELPWVVRSSCSSPQLERPDAVIAAIQEVVEKVRARESRPL